MNQESYNIKLSKDQLDLLNQIMDGQVETYKAIVKDANESNRYSYFAYKYMLERIIDLNNALKVSEE